MKQIKQKVVLRSKIRRAHWKGFFWSGWKTFIIFSSILLFAYSLILGRQFLLQDDYFLVKSISVEPEGSKAAALILKQISSLKGKSIWSYSGQKVKQRLKDTFPEIRIVRIHRTLPNKIKVNFDLRRGVALVRVGSSESLKRVDEEGRFIPKRLSEDVENLPELAVASNVHIPMGLSFLKMWAEKEKLKLSQIEVDSWGEVSLSLESKESESQSTKVIWGSMDSEKFDEKLNRLKTVLADLEKKSLVAQVIQIKDVLIPNREKGDGGQIVGKAFVQLSKVPS